jgi:hypothetical protein
MINTHSEHAEPHSWPQEPSNHKKRKDGKFAVFRSRTTKAPSEQLADALNKQEQDDFWNGAWDREAS